MLYLISLVVSFIIALIFIKPTMRFLYRAGIVGIDQQKKDKPKLPTSAGVIVMAGFLAGVFVFIGLNTFLFKIEINLLHLFAAAFSVIIITFIGFFDDINVSRTPKKDKGLEDIRVGLKQWQKPLLTLPAAIPLMIISSGVSTMNLPFLGDVNFGIFYPLIIIPLAVVFVTNASNMLAGMNGLEAGLGIITSFFIGLYSIFWGTLDVSIISFSLLGSLLPLMYFNKYPAKILPGDSLTYLIGAVFVTTIIIGNIEKLGLLIFAPWILEFILKLRSKFGARSLGNLKNNKLISPYKKIYSLTHLLMKLGVNKEKNNNIYITYRNYYMCSCCTTCFQTHLKNLNKINNYSYEF